MTDALDFSLDLAPEPDAISAARRAVERLAPSLDEETLLNLRHGWELHILAKPASRWGVESDGGARVWFELNGPTDRRVAA